MLVRRRLPEGVVGLATLHGLIGDHLGEDAEPGQDVTGSAESGLPEVGAGRP